MMENSDLGCMMSEILERITIKENLESCSLENPATTLKLYLDDGIIPYKKGKPYGLNRDNLEETHMVLGDDKFYNFVGNIPFETNSEGYNYIQSFLSQYEIPEPEPPSIEYVLHQKVNDYISAFGKQPELIVLSRDIHNHLSRDLVRTDIFHNIKIAVYIDSIPKTIKLYPERPSRSEYSDRIKMSKQMMKNPFSKSIDL